MAHMIETMAYSGETPWHNLGKAVPADLTPYQMLEAAELDWEVKKVPAFSNIDGRQVYVGRDALVRSSDNRVLDVVTEDWNPVQNQEAFEFFNDFIAAGDMEMHTAGSLRDGQIVWALAKVKDSFTIFGQDQVDSYMLFTNPHRFGQSLDIRFTPIRVVCNNTLTLSLNQQVENSFKLNHRRQFDADTAKFALGIAHEKLDQYKEMATFIGSKRYTVDSMKQYFAELFPHTGAKKKEIAANDDLSRNARLAVATLDTQPGANYGEGSYWHLFNTVTFLTDHVLGNSTDTRLTSSWYGLNKTLKTRALEKAVEYATAA